MTKIGAKHKLLRKRADGKERSVVRGKSKVSDKSEGK